MKRSVIAAVAFLLMVSVALPAEAGFRSLANEIDMYPDLDRVWIPFFGLARIFVKFSHPDGIHDVKLAIFEGRGGAHRVDLEPLVGRHVDLDLWSPMVHATAHEDSVHVFMREVGDMVGLFIAARDGDEIVVAEVLLDVERFEREMEEEGDFIALARGE